MHNRNIVDAIIEIVKAPKYHLGQYSSSLNRANSAGVALEEYCKDIFAGTVGEENRQNRINKISEAFSYIGNQHNPPDIILKSGDAIEVKKIESKNSLLLLNSSYPKRKLYSDSSLITQECRECDGTKWTEKDILYVVGLVKNSQLKALSMVYGMDYCDRKEVYESISNAIKNGILNITDVEFAETSELGRVNKVDHLGITFLRMRGMWHIENPFRVFDFEIDESKNFSLMVIIDKEKIAKLYNFSKLLDLEKQNPSFHIRDTKIQDPENPAILKSVQLISYCI